MKTAMQPRMDRWRSLSVTVLAFAAVALLASPAGARGRGGGGFRGGGFHGGGFHRSGGFSHHVSSHSFGGGHEFSGGFNRGSVRHSDWSHDFGGGGSRIGGGSTRFNPSHRSAGRGGEGRRIDPNRGGQGRRIDPNRGGGGRHIDPNRGGGGRHINPNRPGGGGTHHVRRPHDGWHGGHNNININNFHGNFYPGYYHHGDYHPWHGCWNSWDTFWTVNHLITAGTIVATMPRYYAPCVVGPSTYYYWGGLFYEPQGPQYMVVPPPLGAVVYAVPAPTTVVYAGESPYYYYNGAYYSATSEQANLPVQNPKASTSSAQPSSDPQMISSDDHNYKVVGPPIGATVPYVPKTAKKETIGGATYYVDGQTYYRAFASAGDVVYMVVKKPN